jgi:hypothetical protein
MLPNVAVVSGWCNKISVRVSVSVTTWHSELTTWHSTCSRESRRSRGSRRGLLFFGHLTKFTVTMTVTVTVTVISYACLNCSCACTYVECLYACMQSSKRHTHTPTHIHAYMHTHIHTCRAEDEGDIIDEGTHERHTHTYIHTCIHTYTCMQS